MRVTRVRARDAARVARCSAARCAGPAAASGPRRPWTCYPPARVTEGKARDSAPPARSRDARASGDDAWDELEDLESDFDCEIGDLGSDFDCELEDLHDPTPLLKLSERAVPECSWRPGSGS
jgi:hypothetical protein